MKTCSPLRYPGGKSAMAELLSEIRRLNGLGDRAIAEPFAGGAGASLTLLFLGTRSAEAEAAVVGLGEDCTMFGGDGVTLFTLGVGDSVDTNNGRINNDDAKLTCAARQPADIPLNDTAVMFNFENTGVFCGIGSDIVTATWRQARSSPRMAA